jgi:DNA-binding transcriptional LysR family regulator
VIRELKKTHERIELQVHSADTPDLIELLRAGKVDLAIGVAMENHPGVRERQVFRDELMFVFAPSHSWAAGRPISRDELRTQPFIFYHPSSLTRSLLDEHFHRLQIVPSTIMEIGNPEAIKELVKLNLGVSVLAPWTVDKELARRSLSMRPVGARALTRNWVVFSLSSHRLTLAEETFSKLCRQHSAGMRLDRKDLSTLKSQRQGNRSTGAGRIDA